MGLKDVMNKMYNVSDEKITKMASVDIASGGTLILPEVGDSINIKFVGAPKLVVNDKLRNKDGAISARCIIFGRETGLQYDVWLSSTIYKGILAEFKKAKEPVDDELKCIVGRVFTIGGRLWHKAPSEMWKIDEVTLKSIPPKTYAVTLRRDLETKVIDMVPDNGVTGVDFLSYG